MAVGDNGLTIERHVVGIPMLAARFDREQLGDDDRGRNYPCVSTRADAPS
jgi:hypothetical protein